MGRILKQLCPIALSFFTFMGCDVVEDVKNPNSDIKTESMENIEEDSKVKISINAFGDLLIHNSIYDAAKDGDEYNFNSQFEDIKNKVIDADYTIGNLEVPVGKSDFSNYPSFRAPYQLLYSMRDILDVELLVTASNHTLDKGYGGLKTTLNCLDEVGINHIGSYSSEEDSENILIEDINGAKVAILAYTYGTNGYPMPSENKCAVSLIDKDKIVKDSQKAKTLGADFIVVKLHWGNEYETYASNYQKELAEFIFSSTDAQLIIGDHPHVVQEVEKMTVEKDGVTKEGVVIYSLGNFISGQNKEYRDTGIIAKANIVIDKLNNDNNYIESVEYTPVFVDRNSSNTGKRYRVIDINEGILNYENNSDNLISNEEYNILIKYRDYYREKLIQDGFVFEN